MRLIPALVAVVTAAAVASPAVATDLRSPDSQDASAGRAAYDAPAQIVQDLRSPDARDASSPNVRVVGAPEPVVTITNADGFDWGDAAIGAAAIAGLMAIMLGAALTLRRRHAHPHSPVITS